MTTFAKQGGEGWQPCLETFKKAMPDIWGDWGVASEFGTLRAVLLRRPGAEIDHVEDYNAALWLDAMNPERARQEHDAVAEVYRNNGVAVHYVENARADKPNSHFIRDLLLMTPEGAIVCRPAGERRAGEERFVAEALSRLGVPILMTVHGNATFEGADVALAGPELAFLAEGQRTNTAGADQVEWALHQVGIRRVERIRLLPPYSTVHLDGVLSLVDRDLALVRPQKTPETIVKALRDNGFRILDVPAEDRFSPANGVALGPRHLVMPAGNPRTQKLLEEAGCKVETVDVKEIQKSGGAIHCLTGFLEREDGLD